MMKNIKLSRPAIFAAPHLLAAGVGDWLVVSGEETLSQRAGR
jgi:hypothetical protein